MTDSFLCASPAVAMSLINRPEQLLESSSSPCREVLSAMESTLKRGQPPGLLGALDQLRLVLTEESR